MFSTCTTRKIGWGHSPVSACDCPARDGPLMRLTVARQAQGLSLIKHTSLSKQGLKKALGLNNGQHDLCDRDCALSFRNSSAQGRPPI